MKWFRRFFVAVMLLVPLAVTAIYFTPLDAYVPEAEQMLGTNLHEPVKIQHLKIGVMPVPHLVLEGVQVGDKAGIALQSVKIVFDIHSLFEAQRVIHRIVLQNGNVTQAQMEKASALLYSYGASSLPFRVEELQFSGICLVAPKFTSDPVEGKLEFAPDNSLTRAWLALSGKKFTATARAQPGNTFAIEVQAKKWSPPNYPAIMFDSLNVNGMLAGSQLDGKKFSAEAYGARIEGAVLLGWKPEWKLDIRVDILDGRLERLPLPLGNRIRMAGSLHGKGHLSTHGAEIQALPGNLKLDAEVEIKNVDMRVSANAQHALALDMIKVNLSGTLAEYTLSNLGIKLYGGTMAGSAVIRSAEAVMRADMVFDNIALQPVVETLSDDVVLTGIMDGKVKFSAKMKEFDHFPQNLQLDGAFHVKNGAVGKVDLVQAASNPLKEASKGGTTYFNELSSLLSVDASGYHFRELRVSSGALNAEGKLNVSPEQQLNGLLDTNLKGTATLISMPLVISGTLRDPILRPTSAALAGAAAGTALLGPGLGTALGIKAGNLFNKLFGKKSEKTDSKKEVVPNK